MGRNKNYLALIALFACVGTAIGQDYYDDIYYNPKKDKATTSVSAKKTEKVSYYIDNMGDMDVDTYNRRGSQYYASEIDTIGTRVENGEDFVYTQQIQKFYNPTIVVDNASALGDVLSNAHGNVEIIINDNGLPMFAPWYGYSWSWPYYSSYWSPWSWSWNIGPWSWSVGWYDPWFSWNWGPGWGWWNPGPVWGWGPSWGWSPGHAWRPGPGWGPGPAPRPLVSWSPHGNRTVGPRPGWSTATQPGRNPSIHKTPGNQILSGNRNPGLRPSATPQTRPAGVVNNNGRWQYNTSNSTGHRVAGTGAVSNKNGQTVNNNGVYRSTNQNKTTNSVTGTHRNNTYNNSMSTPRSTNRSYGSGSMSTGGARSSAGGRSGGGGGRHR